MNEVLNALLARAGVYEGTGINHEQERYDGRLELTPVLGVRGLQVKSRAVGEDGTVYHEEHSLIAPTRDGGLVLWSLNIHAPGALEMLYRRDEPVDGADHSFVFGSGDPADQAAYRVEVAFDLWPDGALTHRYAWGMPGEPFEARSAARLRPAG